MDLDPTKIIVNFYKQVIVVMDSANSTSSARKTKLDKYDFNPDDNLQRRKKMDRLIKQGHAQINSIRIGQHEFDEERETGPCAEKFQQYKNCLISTHFKLHDCYPAQEAITTCEREKGVFVNSVKSAIEILETRRVNEWKIQSKSK